MSDDNRTSVIDFTDPTFYQTIVEQARDIILVVAADGWILDANQTAVNTYGYTRDELRRVNIGALRAPEQRLVAERLLKRAWQQRGVLFRTVHIRKNGEQFPVEISTRRVAFAGGEALVSVVRDITETFAMEKAFRDSEEKARQQKMELYAANQQLNAAHQQIVASEEELRLQLDELIVREQAIRRQNALLKALHQTTLDIMQSRGLGDVLRQLTSAASELLETPHAFISLIDEEKSVFRRMVGLGYYASDAVKEISTACGLAGQVYKTGELVVIDDYSRWEDRQPSPFSDKLRNAVQVPLKAGDKVIGTFGLVHLDPDRKFAAEEISLLQRFGDLASIAIANAQLVSSLRRSEQELQQKHQDLTATHEELIASEEELKEQLAELLLREQAIRRQNGLLKSLHQTTLAIMDNLDLDDVLRQIITSAGELLETPHGFVRLVDEEQGIFSSTVGLGHYAGYSGRGSKLTEGLSGQAYKTGEIIVIDDYSIWKNRLPGAFFDRVHNIVHVPLKSGDTVVGTLGLAILDPVRKFTADEISLLQRFGDLASIAITNAQLLASLRRSEQNLQQKHQDLTAAHEELVASEEELKQQFDELITKEDRIHRQNIVLTSLHETALGLMHRRELDDVLKMIITSATELLSTVDGFICLVDPEQEVFVRKVAVGRFSADMERRSTLTAGLLGQAYTSGQLAAIDHYSDWEHRFPGPLFDNLHLFVVVPLKIGERVIGALGLTFSQPGRTLADHERTLLQRFGDLAAMSLDTATLIESYRRTIQDNKRAAEALRKSQAGNQALINAIPDAMFIIKSDGTFVDYKATHEQLFVLPDGFLGKTVAEIFPAEIAEKTMQSIGLALKTGDTQIFEYQLLFRGKLEHYEARLVASGEEEILAICRNITDRKAMEEEMKRLSLHDSLTGLYNRAFFEEQMKRLQTVRDAGAGLIVCDVDGLKIVNDSLGHAMGDIILKAVATILRDSFRTGDLVARIGGDEFAVLIPAATTLEFEAACRRIRDKVDKYNTDNSTVPISLSLGFAVSHPGAADMNALFKEADNNMYREKLHRQQSARSSIVQALMKALEARDFITEGHGDRLGDLVDTFARSLGLPENAVADLRLLARFHDIGKVGIPDSILFKADRLTDEEWLIMRRHCEIGYRIAMSAPDLAPIADWILRHQEWWNGQGYPLGIAGQDIPLACRILALADAYDAMTNDRPYRKAMTHEEARAAIRECAGSQFDPHLATLFLEMLGKEAG